jgi:hypothetical protein
MSMDDSPPGSSVACPRRSRRDPWRPSPGRVATRPVVKRKSLLQMDRTPGQRAIGSRIARSRALKVWGTGFPRLKPWAIRWNRPCRGSGAGLPDFLAPRHHGGADRPRRNPRCYPQLRQLDDAKCRRSLRALRYGGLRCWPASQLHHAQRSPSMLQRDSASLLRACEPGGPPKRFWYSDPLGLA